MVHSESEAAGVRLTIDSKTCLLPNEHDPSQLMAASPGKLVRFLVADGAHVQADEAYAEIEVRWHCHAGAHFNLRTWQRMQCRHAATVHDHSEVS